MVKFLDIKSTEYQIAMYEVHGTRQELDSNNGGNLPTSKVRVAVKSGDRELAKRTLLSGLNTQRPGIPAEWPYFNATRAKYCVSVADSVDGGYFSVEETERMKYTWHFFDLSYANRLGIYLAKTTVEGEGAWYIEDAWEPRTEIKKVNHLDLYWGTGGVKEQLPVMPDDAPGIALNSAILHHVMSGFNIIDPNWHRLVSTVSDGAYLSENLRMLFGANTLLLEHFSITEDFSHNSYLSIPAKTSFTIHCRYGIRDDWNKFIRLDGSLSGTNSLIYYEMKNAISHNRVYPFPIKNHSELLRP